MKEALHDLWEEYFLPMFLFLIFPFLIMKKYVKEVLALIFIYLFIVFVVANSRDPGADPPIANWGGGFLVATLMFIVGISYYIGKHVGEEDQKERMEKKIKQLKAENWHEYETYNTDIKNGNG